MLNYSQERLSQRLLTQRSRNQEVPKLITAHQISKSKDARNKLLMQARAQTQHIHSHTTSFSGTDRKTVSRNAQNVKIQQKLHEQTQQNAELHKIIKQLKDDLQKMRQVNKALVLRLRELQTSYRTLRTDLQKSNEEEQRKIKINIYSDVQEYIKVMVQKLTLSLKQDKMTIALESKLENFLTELLEINSVTVQQFINANRQPQISREEPSSFLQINNFIEQSRATNTLKYTPIQTKKQELPSPQHYTTIMQRLNGQTRMSQSKVVKSRAFSNAFSQDSRQESRLRNGLAATPLKRKRIFQ